LQLTGLTVFVGIIFSTATFAQSYSNLNSVLDGAGDWSGGGGYSNISAAAQPGGVSVSSGGELVNYAGFLGGVSLMPDLDTDGDGLANEVDTDNDNDSLNDDDEVTGSAFNGDATSDPNDADSDNDMVNDGAEAIAGTDPGDSGAYFQITNISFIGATDDASIEWVARGGKTYKVYYLDELTASPTGIHLGDVAAAGGSAPWYVTSASYTNTAASPTNRFYYVAVQE